MPPALRSSTFHRLWLHKISCISYNASRLASATSRVPRNPLKRSAPKTTTNNHGEPTESGTIIERLLPRESRTRRYLIRLLVLSPILWMGILHSPFEIMCVNGGSMSGLFNPNYDSDVNLPNAHRDCILVRKRGISDMLPDVNSVRKAKRKADETEHTTDGQKDSKFERGQIVILDSPNTPGRLTVKRIVGLPRDRVQPLIGYPGGEETIIVPWNHLWVEGDAGSRQKSIDSNWYGPVSQNLVIGDVRAILSPWWKPAWIDSKQHRWPALDQGRVEEQAVAEAASDPQVVTILQEWSDGTNKERLQAMKESPEAFKAYFASSEDVRKRVRRFYRNAALILAKDDPDSERFELAQDVIKEMENIYGASALRQGMIRRSAKVPASSLRSEDQQAAARAEMTLQAQGWTIERDEQGKVKTRSSTS